MDIHKVLLKKVLGYTVKEVATEFVIDAEGIKHPVKEKTQTKYLPPDMSALKAYLELTGNTDELEKMTDAELERERRRLIRELQQEEDAQS